MDQKSHRPKPSEEQIKANKALRAKHHREWLKSLGKEGLEEYKSNQRYDKQRRQEEREQKAEEREQKRLAKRELALLEFMLKTDVLFYHHGYSESMRSEITKAIQSIKEDGKHSEYHPYIWNHQGEGKNYMPKSQLGCLWNRAEFETIYDVPLDGSYVFEIFDSGQRGLGSFNYISVKEVESATKVPFVNPGGLPPISI